MNLMQPDSREVYVNGDVTLNVDFFPTSVCYWIKIGQALLKLDECQMDQLLELLSGYDLEVLNPQKKTMSVWTAVCVVAVFTLAAGLCVGLLVGRLL